MKKNFRFYALLLILAVAAFLYFGGGDTGAAVLDTAVELAELADGGFEEDSGLAPEAEEPPYQEQEPPQDSQYDSGEEKALVEEDGWYYSKDEVALYIHTYGRLPDNYVTKKEAEQAGWQGGSVEEYLPGRAIGGSHFGNYEGLLPKAKGRTWTECDINTLGKSSRGAERIIFSNDGLIYYTDDHYESFELLYGEE